MPEFDLTAGQQAHVRRMVGEPTTVAVAGVIVDGVPIPAPNPDDPRGFTVRYTVQADDGQRVTFDQYPDMTDAEAEALREQRRQEDEARVAEQQAVNEEAARQAAEQRAAVEAEQRAATLAGLAAMFGDALVEAGVDPAVVERAKAKFVFRSTAPASKEPAKK